MAQLLLRRIAGDDPPRVTVLPVEVIRRQSA
jgi:DNA-binding LacI/PurR family transcriptional regulator